MDTTGRQAIIVADLGHGDAGKGGIVDYLTRLHGAHTVVRYNGGAQAAHNVVTPDGRHHTFAQFGSGTFVPGVRTHLSRYMLAHPAALLRENLHLCAVGVEDALARTTVDRDALIITPPQQAANRLRELARGADRHGSCGLGVGETVADALADPAVALRAGDLCDRAAVRLKLRRLRALKLDELAPLLPALRGRAEAEAELTVFRDADVIEACADLFATFARAVAVVDADYTARLLREPGTVVFEGAQGVLLDEWYGFHPYTTWSTTTYRNAETLLAEAGYGGRVTRLGVLRAYATRHGPGPFVTEDERLAARWPDAHNAANPWQHAFRAGYPDLVATRYALAVAGGADALAVTHLDRLAHADHADHPNHPNSLDRAAPWVVCTAYRYGGPESDLDGYAARHGPVVDDLLPPPVPDLARQERLTALLRSCTPCYGPCPRDEETYRALLAERLGVPVAIGSYGVTAQQKQCYLA